MIEKKIRKQGEVYLRESSRKEIKLKLLHLGVTKPSKAECLMIEILGDNSAAHTKNQSEVLDRLEALYSVGEDIVVDLRANNGAAPKFEAFWDVVAKHI